MRLRNVKKQQSLLQARIWQLAIAPDCSAAAVADLASALGQLTDSIESICAEHGSSPAALPSPSRRAYAWFKFLTLDDHLERHLKATQRAQVLADELLAASDRRFATIAVQLTDYTGLFKSVSNGTQLDVQFSEGFLVATDAIWRPALTAVLARQSGLPSPSLRAFSQAPDYCAVMRRLERLGSDPELAASGQHYNLQALFTALNREYFQGQLVAPQLVWSERRTRRRLGHYEATRDRVVLSRSLDSPRVPEYVVAYVLYHELLHKHCGLHWHNGRQRAHTREFRAAEQRFQQYEAAMRWLQHHEL